MTVGTDRCSPKLRSKVLRSLPLVLSLALFFSTQAARQSHAAASTLTFRLESFNINLDPSRIVDNQSRRVIDMLHSKLLSASGESAFKGELASHWSWLQPNILQIHLRNDLTFSNGKRLTAEDVTWSLCRLLQPAAPYRWLFSNVRHTIDPGTEEVTCTGLRVRDDSSVEIEVTSDPTRLLPALASSSAAIIPAKSNPGEFGEVPGAGPYVIERIYPNSRVVLKARMGGPITPAAAQVIFQLVQDDSTAAALFRSGRLDAIEISNPTLLRLLVDKEEKLTTPGRLIGMDAHQVRLLIFNRQAISRSLGLSEDQTRQWIRVATSQINLNNLIEKIAPLAIPIGTSYFPARSIAKRPSVDNAIPAAQGKLLIITENDPFSDAIASAIPRKLARADIDHVGLEKSVLVSRLLKKEFTIASITLEAMMNHSAYWLSFFTPGSPFTVFGDTLDGLKPAEDQNAKAQISNARVIDTRGNWFALFQERHLYAFRPGVSGESFLQTGLINYVTVGRQQ